MADYDGLDDATLQQMLSDATSYEERAALRQVIRKRKKERGETPARSKSRGNSVYNRFAGSTAKSSKSGGPPVVKSVPQGGKLPKEEAGSTKPIQSSATPTKSPTSPPVTATPPATPDSDLQPDEPAPPDSPQYEAEPVTTEPADEEEITEPVAEPTSEADPTPEEDHAEEGADEQEEGADDGEPGLEGQEEIASEEHLNQSTPQDTTDSHEQSLPTSEQTVSVDTNLQHYLVAYVNQELFLDPPIPTRGKALYDTCSDSTALCKLINKAVPGTVDMRALSKVSGSSAQRAEAKHDNMTLVIESARAIGCRISDATLDEIMHKDPETINNFLLDLIRAQVVHMPGMEDEPASTFTNLAVLFQKLHITIESEEDSKPVSWRDDPEKIHKALKSSSAGKESGSWRESKPDSTKLTYEERAALRKAEREQRQKEKEAEPSAELTYEERAAQRKAERERRRREREALAK